MQFKIDNFKLKKNPISKNPLPIDSIKDSKSHIEPVVQNKHIAEVSVTFNKALCEYFKLKGEFLNLQKERTEKKKGVCVRCHKSGGIERNRMYYGKCGNSEKCFEIKLSMGNQQSIEKNLINIKKEEYLQKENIIKQKMETTFGYIAKKDSVESFKKQALRYMKQNDKFLKAESQYNEIYNNEERKKRIEEVNTLIENELNNLNQSELSNIEKVQIQMKIRDLDKIRNHHKYSCIEMIEIKDLYTNESVGSVLLQEPNNFATTFFYLKEPVIEKYIMN